MAENKKIVEGQNDRASPIFCNLQQICGKADEVLEVDEIRFVFQEEIRKNLIEKRVVVENSRVGDTGQIVNDPGDL